MRHICVYFAWYDYMITDMQSSMIIVALLHCISQT
jgi:hypothetical protein